MTRDKLQELIDAVRAEEKKSPVVTILAVIGAIAALAIVFSRRTILTIMTTTMISTMTILTMISTTILRMRKLRPLKRKRISGAV